MTYSDYAVIETSLTRGTAPSAWKRIQTLFPYEHFFRFYAEPDAQTRSFEIYFPSLGTNHLLRVRDLPAGSRLEPRQDERSRFRARLVLMLSAFASSHHEARYEADLIACWAGMCSINYEYSKDDKFEVALRKAITAIRERGFVVYDFLPQTKGGVSEPIDRFRDYALEHVQSQTENHAVNLGPPIFTSQADLCKDM